MSYDRPNRQKYGFYLDAGAAGETFTIIGPKGKAGRLHDYGVEGVIEAFVADCTVAIGTASDADAYGDEFALGALALDTPKSIRSTYAEHDTGFTTYMLDRDLPADTAVKMTVVADSTSGMGTFFAIIDWAD